MGEPYRMSEYLEALRHNWFIPKSDPYACGCADMQQYPPKRHVELRDFGRIEVVCFRHTSEDSKTKDCCCAFDNQEGWLTFERYLALLQ
jgi:hypothetical protein